MAYSTIGTKLNQALTASNTYSVSPSAAGDPTSYSAVDAAIAVLVADAASPTQAHVTTLNNAWTTLKAALSAFSNGTAVLVFDEAAIPDKNAARSLIRDITPRFESRFNN